MMTVEVLFFAHFRDIARTERREYDLPDGATVQVLAERLAADDIRFNGLLRYARAAVNAEWAVPGHALKSGDEVGFLPPSSGG